ncbi:MAG: (2Fe-2S)-binding protein [Planctomycetota bacterium]|jgi:carbon-monoxide dehydrogenase small subunit
MKIGFQLNGDPVEVDVDPRISLLRVLRDRLGQWGTKEGCGAGECGSCTVLLDDRVVNACLIPAGQLGGAEVTTIEGLGTLEDPHPIVEAFGEAGAVQCGFCTPGLVMGAFSLLEENPTPTEGEIREALSGNFCRCTGYQPIVDAVKRAAKRMKEG